MAQCTNCGTRINPTGKFHVCRECGQELSRARLSDAWKTTRLGDRQYDADEEMEYQR
jgi:rRNA maturation endonuclease Nob1